MQIFSFSNYKYLIEKAKYELNQLEKVNDNLQNEYIITNIIFTLNHIYDWFLLDENIKLEYKIKIINKFNPYDNIKNVSSSFKKYYNKTSRFPELNLFQKTIRELCNKIKHFSKKEIEYSSKIYNSLCGEMMMQCGESKAQCGAFYFQYYVKIGEDEIIVFELLKKLIDEWNDIDNILQREYNSKSNSKILYGRDK